MSALTAERSFRSQIDHIGSYKVALSAAITSRDANALWKMSDNSSDITYENRVKGSSLTQIDTLLSNLAYGSNLSQWFQLHNQYFSADAGLTGVRQVSEAIPYYRWRVPQEFNDLYRDATNVNIDLSSVYPSPSVVIGTVTNSGGTTISYSAGTTVDSTKASGLGGIIGIKVVQIGASADLVLNSIVLAVNNTSTYTLSSKTIDHSTYTAGKFLPVLSTTTNGTSNTTTGVVPMTSTNGFSVGQHVLICSGALDWNATYAGGATSNLTVVQEVGQVISVSAGTSITVGAVGQTGTPVAGMRNQFSSGATVYPLFYNVNSVGASGTGTNGDQVQFVYLPDRILDLTYAP